MNDKIIIDTTEPFYEQFKELGDLFEDNFISYGLLKQFRKFFSKQCFYELKLIKKAENRKIKREFKRVKKVEKRDLKQAKKVEKYLNKQSKKIEKGCFKQAKNVDKLGLK